MLSPLFVSKSRFFADGVANYVYYYYCLWIYMKCSQLDKKMKKLLIASIGILTLGLGLPSAADKDAKQTAYVATMTGVT